jgi:hypothetical protein
MKIQCRTLFDCTRTGVTGAFRASEIPYQDRAGQLVDNQQHWHRSRNQQRNYETLLQIFGLRTQPQEITQPVYKNGVWQFSFVSESEGVFETHSNPDPLAGLKLDCDGVPMMLHLTEQSDLAPVLTTQGPQQNIWFETINTSTEN